MNRTIKTAFLCAAICCLFPLGAQVFNGNLSAEEKRAVDAGELVVRSIGKAKNQSLAPVTAKAQQVIDTVAALKPKYLIEVIQVKPYKGNEDLFDKLENVLLDIDGYIGIPYYSIRHDTWYDLYDNAVINSSRKENGKDKIDVTLTMEPFGDIRTDISIEKTDDSLMFISTNTSKVTYNGISCISTGNMKSVIYAFRNGDSIVLYGVGAINAPTIFFMKERVETAFVGRIKSFCSYIFKEMDG